MIKVAVVVAMKNEEAGIGRCLDSFLAQTLPYDEFQVVIYDGNSSDGSMRVVKDFEDAHPELNLILHDNEKQVQSAAWNTGFEEAKTPFVVMMGAHTIVAPDFLEQNLKIHDGCNCPCTGGLVEAKGVDVRSKSIAAAFNTQFGSGNAKYWHGASEEEVETVAFGMYRKEVVANIDPLDENIIRGQDWEFNYRITQKYGLMKFSPAIRCEYSSRSDFLSLWKRQYQAGMWKIYIIKKHPRSMLLRHFIPMFYCALLALSVSLFVLQGVILPLLGLLGAYILANLMSTRRVTANNNTLSSRYVSLAFMMIHFGYGYGELWGIIYFFFLGKHESLVKSDIGIRNSV